MLNWREIPFIRLTLPLIVGILLAMYFQCSVVIVNYLLIGLFVLLLILSRPNKLFQYRWLFGIALHLFLFLFGYQNCFNHQDRLQANHFQNHLEKQNTFIGTITNKSQTGQKLRLQFRIQEINDSLQQLHSAKGDLLLYVDHDSNTDKLAYGDQLMIHAKVFPIPDPLNPHAFNFKKYWHHQNVHYQAFIKTHQWKLLARSQGNPILSQALKTRNHLLSILKKYLPTDNEYAVASALILGDKQALDRTLKNAYAGTGAMHVLAVSGLHVGLVYLGLAFFLGFIKIRSRYWISLRTGLLILGVWIFALLTGASPSVMRAATMFSFIILGKAMSHHPSIYNTLAASAFCLLCFNPFLLMEVGFQLSYLAVVGIIYFQPKIYRLWIIDNKIGDYIWQLITVGIAAQITTLPISLFYFHQFPVYFWLSGLVVVPAAMLVLGSGLLLLFTETVLPFISVVPAFFLYWITWIMNSLIFLIRQMPAALISGIWISGIAVLFLYGLLSVIIAAINTKQQKWVFPALAFLVGIAGSYSFTNIQQQAHRQMIIYAVKDHSLIDFIDGKKGITLKSKNLSDDTRNFAAQNNRWANGLFSIDEYSLDTAAIQSNHLWYKEGFVQFFDQRILVLGAQPIIIQNDKKIPLDLIILTQNTAWRIENILNNFTPKKIIFDRSNDWKHLKEWTKECKYNNLDYHDISKSGAFIIDLSK